MKTIKLLFAVLLVMLISSVNGLCQEDASNKDSFGKIIGRIFDQETNLAVNEIFNVVIVDCSDQSIEKNIYKQIESSSRGTFVFNNVNPGIYCVILSPTAGNTIYCYEPDFTSSLKFQHTIKIFPGQISRIHCEAKRGGNLKVTLVDKIGNTISPRSIMLASPYSDYPNDDLRRLHIKIGSLDYQDGKNDFIAYNSIVNDYLDDGEITMYGLYPGRYKIYINLGYLGYGWPLSFTNIVINKDQTAEVKAFIDLTDNTGIEGIVTDQNSTPIKNAVVMLTFLNEDNYYYGSIRTNQNGYYKIVGLKEGLFRLQVSLPFDPESTKVEHIQSQIIQVVKNVILIKNIIFTKSII